MSIAPRPACRPESAITPAVAPSPRRATPERTGRALVAALLASTALVAAGPAFATDVTVMGSNAGANVPTYNRVVEFVQGGVPVLSDPAVRGLVPFVTQTFQASAGGAATLSLSQSGVAGQIDDPFLSLYTAPFNPAMPLVNAVAANDDGGGLPNSRLTANLAAATDHVFVASQFGIGGIGNNNPGTFTAGFSTVGAGNDVVLIVADRDPGFVAQGSAITVSGGNLVYDVRLGGTMLALAGVISDGAKAGGLVKTGDGILILNGANTFTGGFTLNGGSTEIGSNTALGKGAITFNRGIIQADVNNLNVVNPITINGTIDNSIVNTNGKMLTLGGNLSGNGGFMVADQAAQGGLLVVGNQNQDFAGTINIGSVNATSNLAGNVQLGVAATAGKAGIVNQRGTFDISKTVNGTTAGSIAGLVGGTYNLGSKTLTTGSDNTSTTVAGMIQDGGAGGGIGGSLVKVGTGTLTLTGNNTYTGGTTIRGDTAKGIAGGAIAVVADTNLGGVTPLVLDGGALEGGLVAAPTVVDLNGGRVVHLTNQGGTLAAAAGSVLNVNGIIRDIGTVPATLFVTTADAQNGAGMVNFSGINTYAGGTNVNGGVTLGLGNDQVLGRGPATLSNGGLRADFSGILANDVTVAASQTGTVSAATGQVLSLTGALTVAGANAVFGSPTDNGIVILDNGAVAARPTTTLRVAGGTLRETDPGGPINLGTLTSVAASTQVDAGAVLDFNSHFAAGTTGPTIANLQGGSFADLPNRQPGGNVTTGAGATTLTIPQGSFGGTIDSPGVLIKTGPGTLNLFASLNGLANNYAGGTRILGGSLAVLGDIDLGQAGTPVTIDGGTLQSGIVGGPRGTIFTNRQVTLGPQGGTLAGTVDATAGIGSFTEIDGQITGPGGLTLVTAGPNGAGVSRAGFILSNVANDYKGGTTARGVSLTIPSDSVLGPPSAPLTLDGANLTVGLTGNVAVPGAQFKSVRPITLTGAASTVTADTSGGDPNGGVRVELAGNISGTAGLRISALVGAQFDPPIADGEVVLSGVNTFTGDLTLLGGLTTLIGGNAVADGTSVILGSQNTSTTLAVRTSETIGSLDSNDRDSDGDLLASLPPTIVRLGDAAAGSPVTLTVGGNGQSTQFSGTIVDADPVNAKGSLVKTGSGTLTLINTSPYSGPTIVNGGTLSLASVASAGADPSLGFAALSKSTVTVNNGGRLEGNGSVAGLVVNAGGTLAPGVTVAPVDPLAIALLEGRMPGVAADPAKLATFSDSGNATFQPGSVFAVRIAPGPNTNDKLAVAGTATLNGGTVALSFLPPNVEQPGFAPAISYTILTAGGGVTGQFDSVTNPFLLLRPVLTYDPNDVILTLAANPNGFASLAFTRNQFAVGATLDGLPILRSPLTIPLAFSTNAASVRFALDQLSGEVHASTAGVLLDDTRLARDAILSRLRQVNTVDLLSKGGPTTGAIGGADPALGLTLWSQALGSRADAQGDGNASSLTRSTAGVFGGADLALLDGTLRLGLAGGYTSTSVRTDHLRGSSDVDTGYAAAYLGAKLGGFALRGGVTGGFSSIDTTRDLTVPGYAGRLSSGTDARTFQGFAEIGYGIDLGKVGSGGIALEPFAGIALARFDRDAATERGASIAALSIRSDDQSVAFSTVGLRGAATFALADGLTATPRVSAAYQHASGDVRPSADLAFLAGGTPFRVTGTPLTKDAFLFEAGVEFKLANDSVRFTLDYSGRVGGEVEEHAIRGGLNVRF